MPNKKKIILSFFLVAILSYLVFLSTPNKILAATNPTVLTVGASEITQDSALLTGNIENDGDSVLYTRSFEYGETLDYELTPDVIIICDPEGCPLGLYTESIGGLTCEKQYHYRAYARNEDNYPGYGEDMTFTTADCPLPTIVTTRAPSNVGLNSATLNGSIDFGFANQVGFTISLISSPNPMENFSFSSQETDNAPYEMGETFSLTLNNLSCSSTYTYNADGGEDVTFDTLSCNPPIVETGEPVIIEEPIGMTIFKKLLAFFLPFAIAAPGDTTVQLNGNVIDTGGENPVAGFEYGTDESYGNTLEVGALGIGVYSAELSLLEPNIEYHYRAYATNSKDISVGEDQTFMIASPVTASSVTTNEATSIGKNSAILNGEITNTGGDNPTIRGFDYGLDDSYGMKIEENGSFPRESFLGNVSGLICNTTYHYRAYAINSVDTGYGDDQIFITNSCSTSGSRIPIEIIPLPSDLCINIEGVQTIIPMGMEINNEGNCVNVNVVNNPPTDVCPNIDGIQEIIPQKMEKNQKGNCILINRLINDPIDVCPNILENQEIIPVGMEINNEGNCVNINVVNNPPTDVCPNIDGIQETIPAEMTTSTSGECIPVKNNGKEKNPNYYLFGFALMGIITGSYIGLFKNIFAGPISFNEIKFIPIKTWNSLLAILGFKKNKIPWGTVYDSITKQPLDPAYVVLQDLNGKEVATSITDLDGRYGFLVPAGKYRMIASKTNYIFPSNKLEDQINDELYQELYFNEIIDVKDGEVITRNIPMDPIRFDWNEFEKKEKHLMNFFSQRQIWIARISDVIFYLGFIVTLFSITTSPVTYNIVILSIYILLYLLKKTILKPRAYGSIKNKKSHNPLSFAVIRIFFDGSENEIIHKVADKTGRYYCLVPNGNYYAKIENKNLDESYTLVHTSTPIKVTKGYINKKFEV